MDGRISAILLGLLDVAESQSRSEFPIKVCNGHGALRHLEGRIVTYLLVDHLQIAQEVRNHPNTNRVRHAVEALGCKPIGEIPGLALDLVEHALGTLDAAVDPMDRGWQCDTCSHCIGAPIAHLLPPGGDGFDLLARWREYLAMVPRVGRQEVRFRHDSSPPTLSLRVRPRLQVHTERARRRANASPERFAPCRSTVRQTAQDPWCSLPPSAHY